VDDELFRRLGTTVSSSDIPAMPAGADADMQQATRLMVHYPPDDDGLPKLLVVVPHHAPRWQWLNPPVVTVGRLPGSGIVLDDPEVSRLHCRLTFDGEFWHVIDTGSRNGISLRGERLHQRCLRTGDLLRVGSAHLLFSDGDAITSPRKKTGTP